MRKLITSAMAAVVTAGAVLAAAGPANADRRYYRDRRDNDDAVAAAVLGGVAGLALGAALSDGRRDRGYYDNGYRYYPRHDGYYRGNRGYYGGNRGYYGRGSGYYARGGYYDRGYRTCVTRDRVWDPYIGRRVTVERAYAC